MVMIPGVMFGRYRILDRLGSGGMASVYRAFEPTPPREVALKLIDASLAQDPIFRARFRREAAVLAALEHPNIVPIYTTGEEDGQPYICYRYIRGGTLKDVLGQPLQLQKVVALLTPVAEALDFAHRHGVVHRDIKPANILLTPGDDSSSPTPIVADFGVARLLEQSAADVRAVATSGQPVAADGTLIVHSSGVEETLNMRSPTTGEQTMTGAGLTQVGVGLGTPAYMAPEQVSGQSIDGRADQYALAITAYQLLTGTVPFQASTPIEVAFMQVHEPLPPPSQHGIELPAAAEQALLKALAKDPADRRANCAAFVAALAAAPAGVPDVVPARPAPLWRRAAGFVLDFFVACILGSFLAVPLVLFHEPAGEFAVLALVWIGYAWVGNAIGGSLGQRAFGMRVIAAQTGGRPGWRRGFARSAAAVLSTWCFGLGYLWAVFRRDRHTWHDSIAGTSVVRAEDAASAMSPTLTSRPRRLRLASWLAVAAGTALFLALVVLTILEPDFASTRGFVVGGSSMAPTLQDGDRVQIATYERSPARGAIIVFRQTLDSSSGTPPITILERVVAVPGDTVDISGGHLSVNGSAVVEPYAATPTTCSTAAYCHVTLPRGEYYVLGDNRPNSSDSRVYGPISAADIVGTVQSLPKHAASPVAAPSAAATVSATASAAAIPSVGQPTAPPTAAVPARSQPTSPPTAAPTYTPGSLPVWATVVAEDTNAQGKVAEAEGDLIDCFDLFHQLYGLTPGRSINVHLVSNQATLKTVMSATGFSSAEIAGFITNANTGQAYYHVNGTADAIVYLPATSDLRLGVAFLFGEYAVRSVVNSSAALSPPFWFERGFEFYWSSRVDASATAFRTVAVDDARAGTSPPLRALDTSAAVAAWASGQTNGQVRVDAKTALTLDYLARQLGDSGMARLLQALAQGNNFASALQTTTGLTIDQLDTAVDAYLRQ